MRLGPDEPFGERNRIVLWVLVSGTLGGAVLTILGGTLAGSELLKTLGIILALGSALLYVVVRNLGPRTGGGKASGGPRDGER
jgi:drug/metabolite transporter (DMT)-like permease